MITVNLEKDTLEPGQSNSFIAYSKSPMKVEILCFVQPPRPPELRGCPECGRFDIRSGQRFGFRANKRLFENKTGYMQVRIENLEGEVWTTKIDIAGMTLTM